MTLKKIDTAKAPKAIGPYSQGVAIKHGTQTIYVSGQLPIDPATGELIQGNIQTLTKRVIQNIEAILLASGSDLNHVVRTDVFLKDLKKDFTGMNEEYAKHFKGEVLPARQTIQVSELPKGANVEISCIAIIPGG